MNDISGRLYYARLIYIDELSGTVFVSQKKIRKRLRRRIIKSRAGNAKRIWNIAKRAETKNGNAALRGCYGIQCAADSVALSTSQ